MAVEQPQLTGQAPAQGHGRWSRGAPGPWFDLCLTPGGYASVKARDRQSRDRGFAPVRYHAEMPIADIGDISINYRVHGSGPPVLGIMGFGLDQRFWAAQIPTVTEHHSFITFDNRGTGRSTRGRSMTMDDMADDAVGLLDHLEIDRAIVFGASMGGAIAQRIALDHPDRVEALILAITWARPIEFMRRQNALARAVLEGGGQDALVEAGLVRMFTPTFFEVGGDAIDQMMLAFGGQDASDLPANEVLNGQLDAIEKHDVLAELGQIRCPTLVVGGRFDVMVPCFASEEIAAAIPGAELALFETGHGLMLEEMEAFNARLGEFLASIPARG
jgi:pimeloyl-ACP methyl ester carboxylesterase